MMESDAMNKNTKETIKDSRERMVQAIKEELDRITCDLPDEAMDPEIISAMVCILKKYDGIPLPDGFGEDEFLERFKKANNLSPQKKQGRITGLIRDYLILSKMRAASLVALLLLLVLLVNQNTYAKMIRANTIATGIITHPVFRTNQIYKQRPVTLDFILQNYSDPIYLPYELLGNQEDYEIKVSYDNTGVQEFYFGYNFEDSHEWLILKTKVLQETSDYSFLLSEGDALIEGSSKWSNTEVYYNTVAGTTTVLFEIQESSYYVISNIQQEKLLNLVNQLEEIK